MTPAVPPPVLPRMSPQNEARLLAKRWTRDKTIAARRARLDAIVRHRGPLDDEALQLLAFCAYRRVLRFERRQDHLAVKQRLVELGRVPDPPAPIRQLVDRLVVPPGDGPAFAEALLPHTVSWTPGDPTDLGASGAGGNVGHGG